MILDDLLGRYFETTLDGTQFQFVGVVPATQMVRLIPAGKKDSQRVPMATFYAALYMGAIQEIG